MDITQVPAGYKLTELGVIPEEWEVKTLGELGECIIGLTYSPSDINESGILVLRSSNIQDGNLDLDDQVRVRKAVPERLIVREGDLLVCVRNGSRRLIGKNILLDSRVVGETFGAFMSIYRSPLNNYIAQAFSSGIVAKQIDENLGATINQITNRDLNSFRIPLPPLAEQQAIAVALGEMDALLAAQRARLAKQRAVKQGLLQGLLSGKQRLPGFAGEWEVKRLGDYVQITSGMSPSLFHLKKYGKPYFKVEQLNCQGQFIKDTPYFIESSFGVPAGSIIFPKRGASIMLNKIKIIQQESFMDTNLMALTVKQGVNNGYLYYWLSLYNLSQVADTTSIPQINNKHIIPIAFPLPNIAEQEAIAAVLSEADAYLAALEAEHAKTQLLKQGMMQNLLTGKLRLV